MRTIFRFFCVVLTSTMWFTSCGERPTCVDTDTSLAKIQFLGEDGKAKDIIISSLRAIDNEDGFPEFTNDTTSYLALPLNPGATSTTFIIEQTDRTDTIGLKYSVVAKLITPECGLDASFSNLDTTSTTYKTLVIVQKQIHQDVTTNIEITY